MAKALATQVLAADASEGLVVGILGPWGSGKTSFVNLVRDELYTLNVPVLDFNPWMFSGAQQLVEAFFVELSAQLRLRRDLAEVGDALAAYGDALSGFTWLPLVGPWLQRIFGAAKLFGKALERHKEGLGGRREKIRVALTALQRPIVVVVDDIDRLSTSEIRDIFKLVRLTASFPNVIYFVVFDRVRVEDALAEQRISGRDYLEKIIQLGLDLPLIPTNVLNRQIFTAIDRATAGIQNPGRFDENVWPDVFIEVIKPLIRNMRDVRRYAAAIHVTVGALDGHVSLVDVFALEAVRVFLPDVFAQLSMSVEALTTLTRGASDRRASDFKERIDRILEVAGANEGHVRAMVSRLFPAARAHLGNSFFEASWKGNWRRDHRVAHEDFLRLYLERVAGESLQAFTDAEHAWPLLSNAVSLEAFLRTVAPERLEDVIGSLDDFRDKITPDQVVPTTVVLLNLVAEIPERPRGLFEFGSRANVSQVAYRMLRTLREPAELETAVLKIFPQLNSLSAKIELISQIRGRQDIGRERLVSESVVDSLKRSWREEVRQASPSVLAKEPELLRVFCVTKQDAGTEEPQLKIPEDPNVTRTLLRSARSERLHQGSGTRAIFRQPCLAWEELVALYGDEGTLRSRIESLGTPPEDEGDALALAVRYASGWRPPSHSLE